MTSSGIGIPDNTDENRAAAQSVLEHAVGEGRLTLDEFTERVDQVWRAETDRGVQAAIADLPAQVDSAVATTTGGRISTSSIFDDVRRSGRFALRSGSRVSSFFGDVKIDLRNAVITETVVELRCASCFGDIVVTVPKGVEVEISSFRVFGVERVELIEAPRLPGSPTIRISAQTVFGDVRVRNDVRQGRLRALWDKLG